MSKTKEDMIKYCECMEDVKRRVGAIRSFLSSGITLGREDFDYEVVCLHLRKILELIAFASLVANKEIYSQTHEKYIYEWRATQLLKNIEKLNPDFYPRPLNPPTQDSSGVKNFADSDKEFLTRDEFIKLLDLCSDVLHVWNPYTPRERKINFEIPVLKWLEKIQSLLDIHSITLAGNTDVMLVVMQNEDGKVHSYYAGGA